MQEARSETQTRCIFAPRIRGTKNTGKFQLAAAAACRVAGCVGNYFATIAAFDSLQM